MPRINATVGEPLGPHDPEHSPLCRAFQAPGVRSVAIVGNGPLNDAQRKEIDTFDVVVRSAPAASHKCGKLPHHMLAYNAAASMPMRLRISQYISQQHVSHDCSAASLLCME